MPAPTEGTAAAGYLGQQAEATYAGLAAQNHETLLLVDDSGAVVWGMDGARDVVTVSAAEAGAIRGYGQVHNHPAESPGPSRDDTMLAVETDAPFTRIVTDRAVYELARPARGWPSLPEMQTIGRSIEGGVRAEFTKRLYAIGTGSPVRDWPSTFDAAVKYANFEHWREVNRRLATALGATYTETPR